MTMGFEKVYSQEEIDEMQKLIESMAQYEMCSAWRFHPSGDPLFRNDLIASDGRSLGDTYHERLFKHFNGFTPEISKSLGWDR